MPGDDAMTRFTKVAFIRLLLFGIVVLPGLWAHPAAAHRVTVFAWVDGDMVHTQSKFSGGKKVVGGQVIVSDMQGNRLVEGRTDETGAYSFKIPKATAMRIELIAGMGHRGEWVITAEGIGATGAVTSEAKRTPSRDTPSNDHVTPTATADLGREDIEHIVEAALDRKLEPLMRMIVENRPSGPSISDIFGGIGYILGLVGLAAYVHYRKKSKETTE